MLLYNNAHGNTVPVNITRPRLLLARLFTRDAIPYWLIFGIALGIRVIHKLLFSRADPMYGFLLPGVDNYTYDRLANEIAQQFLLGWDRMPFFHGPLYPYFLSLIYLRFGHEHDPAAWTQRLIGALTVVLIFYLARRVFGKKAGWFAGLAAAACPLSLFYEGELLVETLMLFLHAATLCILIEAAERKNFKWWAQVAWPSAPVASAGQIPFAGSRCGVLDFRHFGGGLETPGMLRVAVSRDNHYGHYPVT